MCNEIDQRGDRGGQFFLDGDDRVEYLLILNGTVCLGRFRCNSCDLKRFWPWNTASLCGANRCVADPSLLDVKDVVSRFRNMETYRPKAVYVSADIGSVGNNLFSDENPEEG